MSLALPPLEEDDPGLQVEGQPVAGLVLLLTALALAPAVRALADRVLDRPKGFFARWGFLHAALVVPLGLAAAVLAALVPGTGILAALLKTVFITGLVAAWGIACAWRLDPERLGALGLVRGGNALAALVGIGSYVLLLPAWVGVVFVWPDLARGLGVEVELQEVLVQIVELDGVALGAAIFLAVAVQPLLEEVVFRGFLQPLLVQNLHEPGGVVVTSVLFGLMHGLSAFLPIFALSLLLGWIQLRTRRLIAAWAVHAVHNGLVLALGLAWQPPPT